MRRLGLLIFVVCLAAAWGEDWTQRCGHGRDGRFSFIEPKSWPENLKIKWKVTIGEGYAYNRDVRLMESGIKALQEYTRLTILAPNGRIDQESVSGALAAMESPESSGETLEDAGREQIRKVLAATGGNQSRAAQIPGIERKTLYRKLERMRL